MQDDPAGQDLAAQDLATQAQKTGADILAKLDQLTADSQPTESAPQPAELSMNEQLDVLELLLDAAVNSGNETEVRRLTQQGKDIIRAEKTTREHALEEAQDYFDESLKEYGETGEETTKSSQEVTNWQRALQDLDIFIVDQDKYYDTVLANMHPPAPSSEPQPEIKPEVKERAGTLEELLVALNKAEAAYKAIFDKIQAEKKSVAARLVEERIAKLKQGIGA